MTAPANRILTGHVRRFEREGTRRGAFGAPCPRLWGHRSRGFTLIEVMIALMVLGVGVMGVLAMFPMAMRSVAEASQTMLAQEICRSVQSSLETALRERDPNLALNDHFVFRAQETTIPRCYFKLPSHPYDTASPQNSIFQYPECVTLGSAGAVPGLAKDPAINNLEVWTYENRWALSGPGNAFWAGGQHWTVPADFNGDEDSMHEFSFDFLVYPKPTRPSEPAVPVGTFGPYVFEVRVWRTYDVVMPKFDDPALGAFNPSVDDRQQPIRRYSFMLHSQR